jgi:hypothetical protein
VTASTTATAIRPGRSSRPRSGAKVNVPGLLVGGDAADPGIVYTIDHRWGDDTAVNDFDPLQLHG